MIVFHPEVEQFGDSVQPILIVIMCASGPGVIYCENKASSDPRMNSGCLAEVFFQSVPSSWYPTPAITLKDLNPDEKVFYPPGNRKLTNITQPFTGKLGKSSTQLRFGRFRNFGSDAWWRGRGWTKPTRKVVFFLVGRGHLRKYSQNSFYIQLHAGVGSN